MRLRFKIDQVDFAVKHFRRADDGNHARSQQPHDAVLLEYHDGSVSAREEWLELPPSARQRRSRTDGPSFPAWPGSGLWVVVGRRAVPKLRSHSSHHRYAPHESLANTSTTKILPRNLETARGRASSWSSGTFSLASRVTGACSPPIRQALPR
jgi:hypothetical protein